MSCDYLKCFDRIETECVIQALKLFNFSDYICRWVEIICTDFSLRIQNCGFFSEQIRVGRSVRQGGPASNALFLVVAELLAIALRGDPQIKGANLHEIIQLLNQYADDMDVCSDFDETSIERILHHN